jgi:hypothetical protein
MIKNITYPQTQVLRLISVIPDSPLIVESQIAKYFFNFDARLGTQVIVKCKGWGNGVLHGRMARGGHGLP